MTYLQPKNLCPNMMYKYFGNIKYAFDSIKGNEIHFDSVKEFNDPFECYNELLYIDDPMNFSLFDVLRINNHFSKREDNKQTRQEYLDCILNFEIYNSIMCYLKTNSYFLKERAGDFPYSESRDDLFAFLLKQMNLGNELHMRICKKTVIEYFCKRWDLCKFIPGMVKELTKDHTGRAKRQDSEVQVSCFSEVNDSILMWGYYAKSHRGICVEYDFTDTRLKEKAGHVIYSKNRDFHSDKWYLLKSDCWQHEKEWRIAQAFPVEKLCIPVKKIFFGIDFDYANEELYQEIVDCAISKNIGLFRAVQNESDYKINFTPLLSKEM
mgnify:CR=1 FL=1